MRSTLWFAYIFLRPTCRRIQSSVRGAIFFRTADCIKEFLSARNAILWKLRSTTLILITRPFARYSKIFKKRMNHQKYHSQFFLRSQYRKSLLWLSFRLTHIWRTRKHNKHWKIMRVYFNLLTAFKIFFTANRSKWGNFLTKLYTHESINVSTKKRHMSNF